MTEHRKLKIENLSDILDKIAEGYADAEITLMLKISGQTLRNYISRSLAGDESFVCEWDGVTAQYVEHLRSAKLKSIYYTEQVIRSNVLRGQKTPLVYQGVPTYEMIEGECEEMTPDVREVFGYPRDGIKRDGFGEKIVATVRQPVPATLQQKYLEAYLPKLYGKVQELNVKISGGITRVNATAAPDKMIDAKPAPTVLALEDLTMAVDTEDEADAAPLMVVGEPAESAAQFEEMQESGELSHKPVKVSRADGSSAIYEAGKETLQVEPARTEGAPAPVSDAARQAARSAYAGELARLEALKARAPAMPVPPPPTAVADDPPERLTGAPGETDAPVAAEPAAPTAVADDRVALMVQATRKRVAEIEAAGKMSSAIDRQIINHADNYALTQRPNVRAELLRLLGLKGGSGGDNIGTGTIRGGGVKTA